MADSQNMTYFEASAKENINIDAFFQELMSQVYNIRFGGGQVEERQTIKLGTKEMQDDARETEGGKKKKGCCK